MLAKSGVLLDASKNFTFWLHVAAVCFCTGLDVLQLQGSSVLNVAAAGKTVNETSSFASGRTKATNE
jgi:hypothetical protein